MHTLDRKGTEGFLLLEVLPALLLILAVLVVAMRLEGIRIAIMTREGTAELRRQAFPVVWHSWKESGGLAAVAQLEADGHWHVMDFPDDGWLPQNEAGADNSIIWRRSLQGAPGSLSFWEVDVLQSATGQWQWWGTIINE